MKPSDRYLKIVEWSEEDGCYIGTCPGLMLGGVHGDNEAKVYAELCQAVEEWIVIHEQDGTPLPPATAGRNYSGKFVVRVGKELHRELAVNALRQGVSLNSYCAGVLREGRSPYGSAVTAVAHRPPRKTRNPSLVSGDARSPGNAPCRLVRQGRKTGGKDER